MTLDRLIPCNRIDIKAPRWKQRVVGIASYRIGTHNEINILATGKDGERYYPDALYASGDMIRQQEVQILPSGTKLYLVPIHELTILERV